MVVNILWFINYALNLIYPNCCGICDEICKDDICKKCEIKLKEISKFKIDIYKTKNFKKHLYIFRYDGIIKNRLIDYKFNEKPYIYKAFVNFIIKNKKACRFLKNYDIIIPVPIHNNRKRQRGYNQSALIAKELEKNFSNIHYIYNVLIKKKNNKPQSSKNKEERYQNVNNVYYIKNEHKIYGKKVLILDDIYTTGATVNECSKMLRKAKAKYIDVLTIAKD